MQGSEVGLLRRSRRRCWWARAAAARPAQERPPARRLRRYTTPRPPTSRPNTPILARCSRCGAAGGCGSGDERGAGAEQSGAHGGHSRACNNPASPNRPTANRLQGFEGFLTSKNAMAKNKNKVFKLEDRAFSLSSVTSPAVRCSSAPSLSLGRCPAEPRAAARNSRICPVHRNRPAAGRPQGTDSAVCYCAGRRNSRPVMLRQAARAMQGGAHAAPFLPCTEHTCPCALSPCAQTQEVQAERDAAAQDAAAFGGRGKGAFNAKAMGAVPPAKARRY